MFHAVLIKFGSSRSNEAHACGFHQTTRRCGPLAPETESHSPCLDGFFRCENGERNWKARAGGRPRQIRSFLKDTPASPSDSIAPNARSSSGFAGAAPTVLFLRTGGCRQRQRKTSHPDRAADKRQPWSIPSPAIVRFRAICFIQSESGLSVEPAMQIFLGAIRMNTST